MLRTGTVRCRVPQNQKGVKEMRLAKVFTEICTFCFIHDGEEVPGPIPIPVTLNELPTGGFTFFYDPASAEEDSKAFACKRHAAKVTEMLNKFKVDVKANIVDVVAKEEASEVIEEGELPEEGEEEAPLNSSAEMIADAMDAIQNGTGVNVASKKLMDRIVTGAAGTKAVPETSNPKPGQEDPGAADPNGGTEEWQTWFEDGYEPSAVQPKGDEKEACLGWWNPLPKRIKDELAPKGWPERGSLTRKTVLAWHMSQKYAEFLATIA